MLRIPVGGIWFSKCIYARIVRVLYEYLAYAYGSNRSLAVILLFSIAAAKMVHLLDNCKGQYSSPWEPHLRATGRHLPYGITQRYLPPDTNERAPPNPSHADWYSIYLPRRDGRLSWPSLLDSAPARSRTSDLSITSPTPNRYIHQDQVANDGSDKVIGVWGTILFWCY